MRPADTTVRVIAPPERKYSVWIGGSVAADLMPAGEWMVRPDGPGEASARLGYDEFGPTVVHTCCPRSM